MQSVDLEESLGIGMGMPFAFSYDEAPSQDSISHFKALFTSKFPEEETMVSFDSAIADLYQQGDEPIHV